MFRVHLVLCPGAGVARQARERRRFRSLCSLPHVRFHARTSTLPACARAHHRRPSPAYGVGGVPTSADFGRMGPVPTLPRLVLVRLPSNNASTHTHERARATNFPSSGLPFPLYPSLPFPTPPLSLPLQTPPRRPALSSCLPLSPLLLFPCNQTANARLSVGQPGHPGHEPRLSG